MQQSCMHNAALCVAHFHVATAAAMSVPAASLSGVSQYLSCEPLNEEEIEREDFTEVLVLFISLYFSLY